MIDVSADILALNPELVEAGIIGNGRKPATARRTKTASGGKRDSDQDKATTLLLFQLKADGLPAPILEHKFDPARRWRFDLAWPDRMLAVEIDGGIWLQTEAGYSKGHAHPKRFIQDIEKLNTAALAGWCVLRFTPKMVRAGTALAMIGEGLQKI